MPAACPGPAIEIVKPTKYVGQTDARSRSRSPRPGRSYVGDFHIVFEQNGKQTPLVSLDQPGTAEIKQDGPDRVRITPHLRPRHDPGPQERAGPHRRHRRAPGALRPAQDEVDRVARRAGAAREADDRGALDQALHQPRRLRDGRLSRDARRRRVGRAGRRPRRIPGYPASGAKLEGVHITDPAVKIAFIALRYDQDVNTPMFAYAKDEAGNTARAEFDRLTFPKPFKKSRDRARRHVPQPRHPGDPRDHDRGQADRAITLQKFLRDQRRAAAEERREDRELRAAVARRRSSGAAPCSIRSRNTAVEAAFADQRTYVYQGKDVDRQTHLGFDLARVVNSPIVAANAGKVLYAGAARHLRQLRDPRPRHGRAVALRRTCRRSPCKAGRHGARRSRSSARAA